MHFFIDYTALSDQTAEQGFGPAAVNATDQYNLTSKFELSAKSNAYACQGGMLIAQKSTAVDSDGNALLNIIIKPTDTLFSSGTKVAYFIYRGISMDSLITVDGTSVVAYDEGTNNDLVARIYSADNIDNGDTSDGGDSDANTYASGYLGYDNNTLDASLQVDEIFYNSTTIQPIKVNEGDWFGNFNAGTIGFEVVMESDKLNITLGLVRGQNIVIDVSLLTDAFQIKATREQILGFMDPAALFGLHFTVGIKVATGEGAAKSVSTLSGQDLYDTILSFFYTCNNVYVDIRNERGYSYNFYSNYGLQPDGSIGNNIQIGPSADDTDLLTQIYSNNSWPILIIADGQSTSFSDTENTVYLTLRIDDNIRPLLYNVNIGSKPAFNDIYPDGDYNDQDGDDGDEVDDDGPVDAYSNPFSYNFPVVTSSDGGDRTDLLIDRTEDDPPKKRVVYYIKSHYHMRQSSVSKARPNTALGAQKYYHSAFCPIDLPNIGNTNNSYILRKVESPHSLLVNEPLNIDTGFGGFTYASGNKVIWDNNCILFYSNLLLRHAGSGKKFLPTYIQKITGIDTSVDDLFRQLDIICKTYQKKLPNGSIQSINIIGVNNYSVVDDAEKESALFFGVTKAEFDAIGASNVLISNLSHRYIYLQRSDTYVYKDASTPSGGNFYEYVVMVQGLNSLGVEAFVTPTILDPTLGEQPILVYSKDNLFFNSIAFGLLETVTPGTNQIQYNATSDGKVHVNTNIDPIPPQPISFYYNGIYITQFVTINSDKYLSGQHLGRPGHPKDPDKVVIPSTGVPDGYEKLLVDYRPKYPGISAKQSFIKANGDVLTWGSYGSDSNYQLYYRRIGRKNIMVHFDNTGFDNNGVPSSNTYPLHIQNSNLNVDVKLTYPGTQRRFTQPMVAAIVIAALIENKLNLASGGFSLDNGTCFPSVEHVNGEAVDIGYYPTTSTMNVKINEAIIDTFTKYKFTDIIIGDPAKNEIFDQFETTSNGIKLKQRADHDTHLHFGKLKPDKK